MLTSLQTFRQCAAALTISTETTGAAFLHISVYSLGGIPATGSTEPKEAEVLDTYSLAAKSHTVHHATKPKRDHSHKMPPTWGPWSGVTLEWGNPENKSLVHPILAKSFLSLRICKFIRQKGQPALINVSLIISKAVHFLSCSLVANCIPFFEELSINVLSHFSPGVFFFF